MISTMNLWGNQLLSSLLKPAEELHLCLEDPATGVPIADHIVLDLLHESSITHSESMHARNGVYSNMCSQFFF